MARTITGFLSQTKWAAAAAGTAVLVAGLVSRGLFHEWAVPVTAAVGTTCVVAFAGVVRRQLRIQIEHAVRQLEALHGLWGTLGFRLPLPELGGFRISADAALALTDLVLTRRPKVICEFGSGLSTVILAYCAEKLSREDGIARTVVSFEHEEAYQHQTRELLRAHRVHEMASVVLAPLRLYTYGDGEDGMSYDPEMLRGVPERSVELLFVDGPPSYDPGSTTRLASVMAFIDRLSDRAVLVFDDADRDVAQIDAIRRALGPTRSRRVSAEKGLCIVERDVPTAGVGPSRNLNGDPTTSLGG